MVAMEDVTVEKLRENLSELVFHDPNADVMVNQLCDLWQVWLDKKDSEKQQVYYQGLASLKLFNTILNRLRPRAPRGKSPPKASDPMGILLAKHLNRSEAND